ncbi:hypothetical protein WJU23_03885 [Prosthecobacter sp. SYSU 5D2]|uniref:hypothetical protein n=1 Tax=Prosthecobacter sp. SYSU 5D2 TaxID=3134134 RepID=UPI0031FEED1D
MRAFSLSLVLFWVSWSSPAASPAEAPVYYDEATKRYLTLEAGDFGKTRVLVRFAGDPGSMNVWTGQGSRSDKEMFFSRMVNEGEDPGVQFVAKISESKIEVDFKPQQKAPVDAGINGSYRRVNDSKLLQLAKKEFQAADERLQNSLKAGTRSWDRKDRPALDLWKEQWPALRQKWVDLFSSQPSGAGSEKASVTDKTAKDWVNVAQATARGYYFVETLPDPKTGLGWEGDYFDLGGAHINLRLGQDGKLRATLVNYRMPGDEAATLEATFQPEEMREEKNGTLVAEAVVKDAEVKEEAQQARVRLTKTGRYLQVETENTRRYAGRGWFDGIYRGAPVPVPAP